MIKITTKTGTKLYPKLKPSGLPNLHDKGDELKKRYLRKTQLCLTEKVYLKAKYLKRK